MIVDSNKWTGAKGGGAWGEVGPVKRSKFLRWGLLFLLLLFVTAILGLLSGRWTSLVDNSLMHMYAMFFLFMWLRGWGSPFRSVPFWMKNRKTRDDANVPDEFEVAIYARANVSASKINAFATFGIFVWLGYATAENYAFPTDGRTWIAIGCIFCCICALLPTLIAEFRTAFPNEEEWEEAS